MKQVVLLVAAVGSALALPAAQLVLSDPVSHHIGHAGNGYPDTVTGDGSWQPIGREIKTVAIVGAGVSSKD